MAGAAACAVELAISGTVPLGTVLPAMLGVHAIIGVGEAVITVAAVSAVLATRPDLIHGPAPDPVSSPAPRRCHEALHDPRPRRSPSGSPPPSRRTRPRRPTGSRRSPATRRSSTRAGCTPSRTSRRCPTTPSRASTTRAWRPASPASAARCWCSALGYGLVGRDPPPGGRGVSGTPCTARAWPAIPRARSIASIRGRRSSGSRGSRVVGVSTPLRRLAGVRRLRARARRDRGARAASSPALIWSRVRVDPAARRLRRRRSCRSCAAASGSSSGRSSLSEAGLATFALVTLEGDDRHASAPCCSARPRASRTSCTGSSGCARRGCSTVIAAFMYRYVFVIADEARRMRAALAARGYRPRHLGAGRPRSAARRPRCSCAATSAASASTWRCSRAATPGRCRACAALAFRRADMRVPRRARR